MNILKPVAILGLAGSLTGCFLEVIVPTGGKVTSLSSTRDCAESRNCVIEITDATFSEAFTAIPEVGYVFSKWMGGGDFLCADSTDPVCTVSNTPVAGDSRWDSTIASYFTLFLMPVFENVGIDTDGDGLRDELDEDDDNDGVFDADDHCPLNPDLSCGEGAYVIADGKIWFQPDLFTGLSWNSIDAVCPEGICSGLLNGYNMNEWVWANNADVQSLFESYGPANECATLDSFFLGGGWRKTNSTLNGYPDTYTETVDLVGWTATGYQNAALIDSSGEARSCTFSAGQFGDIFAHMGAWFYLAP